jgi:phosphoserine aminotransferase
VFLQGGATTLQALLPLNLAGPERAVRDYGWTWALGREGAGKRQALSLRTQRRREQAKEGGYTRHPGRVARLQSDAEASRSCTYTPNGRITASKFHQIPGSRRRWPLVADVSPSSLSAAGATCQPLRP